MLDRFLQPKHALYFLIVFAFIKYTVYFGAMVSGYDEYTVGGDFNAFWTAAGAILNGDALTLYAPDGLQTVMKEDFPDRHIEGLHWQYPPHAALIFSPIGTLPFFVAYGLWFLIGLAVFAVAMGSISNRDHVWMALLATGPVSVAFGTGQTSLITTGLLLLSVFFAKKRPVIAGLAAALLTIKPQLGIFLPLVFICGGHWRAFAVAALASLALWFGSAALLGVDVWRAFFERIFAVTGWIGDGIMPHHKMLSIHSALLQAAIPQAIADSVSGICALCGVGIVVWVCRKTNDPRWRYAVVSATTVLILPYSWFYEFVILVPAIWFVVRQGYRSGWLIYERESVAFLVLFFVLVPGPEMTVGLSMSFVCAVGAAVIIARRVNYELRPAARRSAIMHADKFPVPKLG
ncbi:MAG: glycosyltransferase family 87 protein [Pseudomonadota bacterium]